MSTNDTSNREQAARPASEPKAPTPNTDAAPQARLPYQAPEITSSKIFHRVMLASPQPGFPGCSTY